MILAIKSIMKGKTRFEISLKMIKLAMKILINL